MEKENAPFSASLTQLSNCFDIHTLSTVVQTVTYYRVLVNRKLHNDAQRYISGVILRLSAILCFSAVARSVSLHRVTKRMSQPGFGNCGGFAIIRSRAGELTPVLIPSNSTGLKSP